MNIVFTASQAENLLLGTRLLKVADDGGGLRQTANRLFAVTKSELNGCTFTLNQEPEFGTKGGGR